MLNAGLGIVQSALLLECLEQLCHEARGPPQVNWASWPEKGETKITQPSTSQISTACLSKKLSILNQMEVLHLRLTAASWAGVKIESGQTSGGVHGR